MDHLIVEQDETIKEDRGSEIPTTSQSQRVDISRIQSAYSDRCHSRSNFPLVLDEYGEEKDPRVSINRIFSWILCFHFCCQRICQLDKWKVHCLLMTLTQRSCLLNSLRWLTYFYNESWSKFPCSYSVFGNSWINRDPMRRFSNLISKKEVK